MISGEQVNDDEPSVIGSTTTTKLAQRMLVSSRVVAGSLALGVHSWTAVNILLELYLAEDVAKYISLADLDLAVPLQPTVMRRWIELLKSTMLVEEREGLLALTEHGHRTVIKMLEALFAAQRVLD